LYSEEETVNQINADCRKAHIGCVDCKKVMAANLLKKTNPMTEKRIYYEQNPKIVAEIIAQGSANAREIARKTMAEVRAAIKMNY